MGYTFRNVVAAEGEARVEEEHGELKACRRLLSIHARLHNNKPSICCRGLGTGFVSSLGSIDLCGENFSMEATADTQGHGSGAILVHGSEESAHASEVELGLRRLPGAESLSRKEVMEMLERLYRDHPGAVWRRASREAVGTVEARGCEDSTKYLIYGEISFIAFAKLLETYAPSMATANSSSSDGKNCLVSSLPGFTFYDLGCGAGRPVFMASLLMTSCVKSCGVEIIPSMHQMNKELLQLYDVEIRKWLHPIKQVQNISFLCGDLVQVDWSDADIVFTNATCFDDKLFESFEARAEQILKEGAVVIIVTRSFKSDAVWELVNRMERRMSWSSAVVSVHRKKTKLTS